MLTIDDILKQYPGTKAKEWTQRNEAWIHKDAVIGEKATIQKGTFRGGYFQGGTFQGGTFQGGIFRGGTYKDTPLVIIGACPYTITLQSDGIVNVGCKTMPLADWETQWQIVAEEDETEFSPGRAALIIAMLKEYSQEAK